MLWMPMLAQPNWILATHILRLVCSCYAVEEGLPICTTLLHLKTFIRKPIRLALAALRILAGVALMDVSRRLNRLLVSMRPESASGLGASPTSINRTVQQASRMGLRTVKV
jgi:hypothetical protein